MRQESTLSSAQPSIGSTGGITWHNWARNQRARPVAWHRPATEAELVAVVQQAAAAGRRVKAVGSGHSFTDIACTDGHLVELSRYDRVVEVDPDAMTVTVEAGITLAALNDALARRGVALANLGDIDYQTVSGAVATSTHGTGRSLTGLAAQIVGLRMVLADGRVVDCSAGVEAELFHCARVSLGALGIVSTLTVRVVPAFNLLAVEEPQPIDAVLGRLDDLVDGNDHFELYWVPHTSWALTKANNRTDGPLDRRHRLVEWRDDILMQNHAFGALCRIGRRRPSWIPKLATAMRAGGRVTYVDESFRVFTSPRRVRFTEMEYAIPRGAAAEALNRVRRLVDDSGLLVNFPVEVRFTAPDDVPLSTASGRESCYIAVHMFEGMDHERYFAGVERIMDDYDGRPHWGKLHFQDAATLARRYPGWERFVRLRDRIDPERRFGNAYLERVLG